MDPVVHFEMPAEDTARTKKFYESVFGWQMTETGPEMGNYLLAGTTEVDENRMPKKGGAINGGFYKKTDDPYSQHPSVVIAVDNLDESMKKVTEAGGTIHGEPYDIPGIGRYVSVVDTENNRVSMLQPLRRET